MTLQELSLYISENVVKKVNLPLDVLSSVTMWDLPGTEDIDLKDTYYRDVDAAIGKIVFLNYSWSQKFTACNKYGDIVIAFYNQVSSSFFLLHIYRSIQNIQLGHQCAK